MKINYIHHSGFLIESNSCYYLFDYEKGHLPRMDVTKPIFVLSSHGHHDHYNPEIFLMLKTLGMQTIYAILQIYKVPGICNGHPGSAQGFITNPNFSLVTMHA